MYLRVEEDNALIIIYSSSALTFIYLRLPREIKVTIAQRNYTMVSLCIWNSSMNEMKVIGVKKRSLKFYLGSIQVN